MEAIFAADQPVLDDEERPPRRVERQPPRVARALERERLQVPRLARVAGDVERGEENVSIDSLARIAKALKVALHDLFSGI